MENTKLDELKTKNPILEVADRLGFKVNKQEGTFAVRCVFHQPDNHPSLILMSSVNRYECKACGEKGDVISLIQKVLNCDFKTAVSWLDPNFFSSQVTKKHPATYLREERGISQETETKFSLRYDDNRIIIPLQTGEKYRWLYGERRYTQKKGTSACLFKTDDPKDFLILSEGEFDAMIVWQTTGYPVWTGSTGVETFTPEWVSEINKIEGLTRIYIAFDNDEAGNNFAKVHAHKFEAQCFRIKPTHGKDWTEYFIGYKKSKSDFDELLKSAETIDKEAKKENFEDASLPWPSPLLSDAFYGLAGEFIKVIEPHTEADPAALLLNFLIAFGSVIGDKPHIKLGAGKHPLRLFGVLVGATAKGRKGESWRYPRKIFGEIDDIWNCHVASGLSSGEGLIWAVRDKITRTEPIKEKGSSEILGYQEVIEDQGVEDKRLLVVEEEFASILRVLGREGNTLSAIIRSAWDTGDLHILTKNNKANATGAHISILGHITKDELLSYLTLTESANGFGNRFVWFCVKRSKMLPFGGNLDDVDYSLLLSKIKSVVEYSKDITVIDWAIETKPLWQEIYPSLSEGKLGMIGAMSSRAEAIVLRLAGVYALLDKSDLIKPPHLLAAMAVWNYADKSVEYLFKDKTGNQLADLILTALKSNENGMSRTDITNFFGRNKSSSEISTALNILNELSLLRKEINQTEGRNEERLFVKG